MRNFTRTHNDLRWLFPIAKTKAQALEIFKNAEEQAKYLADSAGVEEKDLFYEGLFQRTPDGSTSLFGR